AIVPSDERTTPGPQQPRPRAALVDLWEAPASARRRGRHRIWVGVAVVVAIALVCDIRAYQLSEMSRSTAQLRAATVAQATPPTTAAALPSAAPTVATAVGDRTLARGHVLDVEIDQALKEQAAALLRHDRTAFMRLASGLPATTALGRRYRNLTALRVSN